MLVSLCIVAYNEQDYLPKLFDDIRGQNYSHSLIEIVLVNSVSTDETKHLMEDFKEENKDFKDIIIVDNPRKNQASGWNAAIVSSTGDVIIRMDAHSSIPNDFVLKNIECIRTGEDISGGPCINITDYNTSWNRTLLLAENSIFGSSIAPYRRNTRKSYVKSISHGAYRREVFEKAGVFNEALGRTEDNEIHYRMRNSGFRICFSPDIVSYQYARKNLKKMIIQKYLNGYWIGLTLGICPRCFSFFHFTPLFFLIGIIFTTLLAIMGIPQLGILMWGFYWTVAILMAALSIIKSKFDLTLLLLPILFFLLHISYGIGTLIGLIKMPSWRKKIAL